MHQRSEACDFSAKLDKKLDKWRQMTINIMVLSGVWASAEEEETGAIQFDLGMFWGGVPGLSVG